MTKIKDQYSNLADLYDMEANAGEVRGYYKEWKRSLLKWARQYKVNIKTIVDLACGTGNTTIPWLTKKGCKVIGVDVSAAMLKVAKKKSKRVKWYEQDLRRLKIKEKADAATCHFDALNHILEPKDLQKVFVNVAKLLNKGGLFQFDINTEYWFKWLNGREKLYPVGRHYFIARNEYDPKRKIGTFHQLWFVKKKDNLYSRRAVKVNERPYTTDEIRKMINKAGLNLVKIKIHRKLNGKPIRMLYLARKPIKS